MMLNKDLVQASILVDADNKEQIKTKTGDIEDNTFNLHSSSKQQGISPPIRSIDSTSIRCHEHIDKSAPSNDTKTMPIKCTEELYESKNFDGSEEINIGFVKQSGYLDAGAMTTSAMDITVNGLDFTSPAVRLIMLYHMMWCIRMGIVENPPLWPYADEYRACRSPIIYTRSKVMKLLPPLTWINAHKNVKVSVTKSFLSDIIWCAQYVFELNQIMYFSFQNLLKYCKITEDVAESYSVIGGGPDKPPKFVLHFYTAMLYHIVWCVQNESLPFKGLPISYQEVKSCQSPLNLLNKKTIQGTRLEWWGSSESIGTAFRLLSSTFMDLIKCARKKIFQPDDMISPDSILGACGKITHPNLVLEMTDSEQLQKAINVNKARNNQYRLVKPIYVSLGVIVLLFGSLCNLFTCVIALRKKLRQTSTGIYMFSLAIIDTFFLYVRIVPQILTFVVDRKSDFIINTIICKMSFFFINYVDHLSAWLRLCFTIERTVAVTLPYIYHVYFSRCITLIILLACCMIMAVANVPVILFLRSGGEYCQYQNNQWSYVLAWIDMMVSTILPFTGIIASNSILIYSLCKARRQRQQLTDSQVDIHKITMMCITTSLCFVLSAAPIRVYLTTISKNPFLYNDDRRQTTNDPNSTNLAVRFDVKLLLDSFRLVNSSVNFLLYCISGSVFRQELLKLFMGK